jgi:hypothetical protein
LIISLLTQARDDGRFDRKVDLDAFAHLIMSIIEGAILICRAGGEIKAFTQTGDTIRNMIREHSKPVKKKR